MLPGSGAPHANGEGAHCPRNESLVLHASVLPRASQTGGGGIMHVWALVPGVVKASRTLRSSSSMQHVLPLLRNDMWPKYSQRVAVNGNMNCIVHRFLPNSPAGADKHRRGHMSVSVRAPLRSIFVLSGAPLRAPLIAVTVHNRQAAGGEAPPRATGVGLGEPRCCAVNSRTPSWRHCPARPQQM